MLSKAYLLVLHHILSEWSIKRVEVLSGESLKVEILDNVRERQTTLVLDLPEPKPEDKINFKYTEALERYQVAQLVLGMEFDVEYSLEQAIARVLLKAELEKSVRNCVIQNGLVSAYVGGVSRSWPLNEALTYESLLGAECVEGGYEFTEVRGQHFKVTCPSGLIRIVTLHDCDCRERAFNRDVYCLHNAAVKKLHELRANLYVKKIVKRTTDD
jgi:hypothetical protein